MKMIPSETSPGFVLLYSLGKISPDEPYTYDWHAPKLQDDPYADLKVEIKMELTPQSVLLKFNEGDSSEVLECFIDFPFKDPIIEKDSILIKTLPIEEFFRIHISYCNREGAGASDFFPDDIRGQILHDFHRPSKEEIIEYFEHWNDSPSIMFDVHFISDIG